MLTAQTLNEILLELDKTMEIGCTYDIKERFNVGLKPLELLDLVKSIKTRVPVCGKHCGRYQECQWMPLFDKRKSIAKFKLTTFGKKIITILKEKNHSEEELIGFFKKEFLTNSLISKILTFIKTKREITVDMLILYLLKETKYKRYTLRITLADLLDFLASIGLIATSEGIITTFV